uniref:Diazepam-binding inhibitor (GABA receptor modulator, acyl-CoA-binding protein) n=1 Tax=Tetraselmis sp. GSL018 TaxID=582737 RepID=A0A061SK90_9CHLO|mmetsp:Transcript_7428/g.17842  ORF Transcript_7428/g.17842 Transcript_7428/m.17842 type:complete len:86 (+) Transcript_7428:117-374(+)|eukprot:CAMPEP_0177578434 /NCGR_PEP_ID=MMETSP0419_2-20121207/347_1 /TAXON_ID=582737 /ORGANISM="Tetraselmis sp., Strain GSL018" /LENGTH=85 /DNA_ID=CAMNT_0019066879 /DNA_START=87 /DNA_END=344 /DNA_ORIENTATION=-
MGLKEDFDAAATEVKSFKKVSQADQLILYGLFKQVTVGDCTGDRPGIFDQKGRAKYDAWMERKGMNKEKAMEEYIAKVAALREQE